jgi:hypothetical protein
MRLKASALLLWVISLASIVLALKASSEPMPQVFRDTWIDHVFQQFSTGNSIIFDLAVGFLVSLIFYLLVVWYPGRRRRNTIRHSLEERYRSFKEGVIDILLNAGDRGGGVPYDADLVSRLLDLRAFRSFFKEPVSESQDRWHTVLNGLDESLLRELLIELEMFLNEVTFVLSNVDIRDRDTFSFFKRLSEAVYRLRNCTSGYDEVKPLSQFLWELFAGWSFVEGYADKDIVKVMIDKI